MFKKRIENLSKATKKILDFTKETFSEMSKEDRLEEIMTRIQNLNIQGEEYETLAKKINSLSERINTLKEIESEFLSNLDSIDSPTKESMMLKIELKTKLEVTYEELYSLISERDALEKQAKESKNKYIKEFSSLNKLLNKNNNEELLQKRSVSSDVRSFKERFEEAVNRFTIELFEIKDSTRNPMVTVGNVQIYEDSSIVEAKFDIEDGIFLVSVSSIADSIKIGLYQNGNIIEIGKGENFSAIKWDNDDFGNHFIVKFFDQLIEAKKELEKQESLFLGCEKPKHLYLAY